MKKLVFVAVAMLTAGFTSCVDNPTSSEAVTTTPTEVSALENDTTENNATEGDSVKTEPTAEK